MVGRMLILMMMRRLLLMMRMLIGATAYFLRIEGRGNLCLFKKGEIDSSDPQIIISGRMKSILESFSVNSEIPVISSGCFGKLIAKHYHDKGFSKFIKENNSPLFF